MKRALPTADRGATKLELPTIMDRALAAKHGAAYVRLVAFAIDIDRAYVETEAAEAEGRVAEDLEARPLGWEVFVTTAGFETLDFSDRDVLTMIEDICLGIFDQAPDELGYGSQLAFAVFDAIERGDLPAAMRDLFRGWRSRPKQLVKSLDALRREREQMLPRLASHCLQLPIDPPLTPPTREILERMATPPPSLSP